MKPLIVANWKCNPTTLKGAKLLFGSVKRGVKGIKNVEVVICPPFLYISNIELRTSNIKLGTQDCFWERKGAFTGEISPPMLKDIGCEYVIVGHSERRELGETDEMINKKIKAALKSKLKPILCIGETEKERKSGRTFQILKVQLKDDLKNLTPKTYNLKPLIVAYEPVWAIGTGSSCQPAVAKKTLLFLRKFLKGNPILYGGSVNSKNAASYIKEANFNGLLVGSASLKAEEFVQIIKNVIQS